MNSGGWSSDAEDLTLPSPETLSPPPPEPAVPSLSQVQISGKIILLNLCVCVKSKSMNFRSIVSFSEESSKNQTGVLIHQYWPLLQRKPTQETTSMNTRWICQIIYNTSDSGDLTCGGCRDGDQDGRILPEVVVMYSLSSWSEHGKGLEVLNEYFKARVGGSFQSFAKLAISPLFGITADIGEYFVQFSPHVIPSNVTIADK